MQTSTPESTKAKRTRRCGSKKKTGCKTCKARHLKCDETKPVCQRCTRSGWICDGYPPVKTARSQTSTPPVIPILPRENVPQRNPLLDFPGTSKEHKSLHFFFSQMSYRSGLFDTDFWRQNLPPIVASQKPAQHLTIAIAAMHEHFSQNQDTNDPSIRQFSLIQVNKAIGSLRTYSPDRVCRQVTLLTCVLFLWLEGLSNNREFTWVHLDSGFKILESYKRDLLGRKGSESSFSSPESGSRKLDPIIHELGELLWTTRVALFVSWPAAHRLVGIDKDIKLEIYPDEPFSSISEARLRLNTLFGDAMQPDRPLGTKYVGNNLLTTESLARKRTLALQLESWTAGFSSFIVDHVSRPTMVDFEVIRMMQMTAMLATIWNSVTSTNWEAEFDKHITTFQKMVALCQEIINAHDLESAPTTERKAISKTCTPQPSPPPTENELQLPALNKVNIIFILYFITLKCRSPSLRLLAFSLYDLAPPQPGVFQNAWMPKLITKYVMEKEEAACKEKISEAVESWPKDEERIHAIYAMPLRSTGSALAVNFLCRPGGEGTEWVEHEGEIPF